MYKVLPFTKRFKTTLENIEEKANKQQKQFSSFIIIFDWHAVVILSQLHTSRLLHTKMELYYYYRR